MGTAEILLILAIYSTNVFASIPMNNEKLKYQVIRAHADSFAQLEQLRDLYLETQHELDFWLKPTKVGHKADIMVDDEKIDWLKNNLKQRNVTFDVVIDDVEKLILEKEHNSSRLSRMFGKRMNNEGGNRARYNFGEYQPYDKMVEWMREIERKYPTRAKVFSIGTTHEGREIQGIKIGSDVSRTDKRVFWIDGGIHAREWAAIHTVLWFIDRLIADYEDDALVRNAVDRLNFYIIPVANPDGYEYSRSDVSPMVRLWRKNRAGVVCKKDRWFRDRCCGGIDLNRNFDWFFGEIGSSTDKCSEIYQGSAPFSEAESRAIRDKINSDELKNKVDGFLTLHTYSQMWIHPYSHARKTFPKDINDIDRVGRAAVRALENTFGTKYKFGTGSDILYPSSGGSDDWAKGRAGIKYVYLLELRPGEDVWDGFILDQRELIPTAKETWNGIKVVIQAVLDKNRDNEELPATFIKPLLITTTLPPPTTTTATTTTSASTTVTIVVPSTTRPPPPLPPTTSLISPIFISTSSAPLTTTTPKHLDAFYKLGKRRFKFVSIKTFIPTTPSTIASKEIILIKSVTRPAFAPTVTMLPPEVTTEEKTISQSSSFVVHVDNDIDYQNENDNNGDVDDLERGRSSTASMAKVPAFVRRPSERVRTRPSSAQQIIRRIGPASSNRQSVSFRNRSATGVIAVSPPQNRLGSSNRCADRVAWCGAWLNANRNVCSISSIYMRQDCARTCGFCR